MKPSAITKSLYFDTDIGMFHVNTNIVPEAKGEIRVSLLEKTPMLQLPTGMSVVRCRAALLQVSTMTPIKHITFSCTFKGSITASPCTGEYLDAQEWENSTNIVCVGTEDIEKLEMRQPFFASYNCAKPPITFSDNSIDIHLLNVPKNSELSMHFIIAENLLPEPTECSAWFAVDFPHSNL